MDPTLTVKPSAAEKEILIVGSSRVAGLQWRKYDGYTVKLVSIGGLQHENLIKEVDSRLTKETTILILVCLQVELHSRTKNKRGQGGMVYANPTPPLEKIVSNISCADYRWRKNLGLTVVWVAPYTPNLLLHNEVRKRARKWGNKLLNYEKEMAEHFMGIIELKRVELLKLMRQHKLIVEELKLLPHHLTVEAESDGLHLGSQPKRSLFGDVIQSAILLHQNGPPEVQEVSLPLQPDLREAVNMMRRQKRKMQRTRTAERALFQAAAEENAAKKHLSQKFEG